MAGETIILDGSPSPSALRVAALRALHQTVDRPVVFADPLAARILGRDSAALLETYAATAAETARLRGTLAARHVMAEEIVDAAAARGVRQCVILGAGLDTFAYRHAHADLAMFELDHPATQAWKRDLVREAGIATTGVRYAAVDLERDDLFGALAATGFDVARPAIFVILGVVAYLARATAAQLFAAIGGACGGDAEIVLDYTEPFEDAPAPIKAAYTAVAARLAAGGEPWINLFAPDVLHRMLADCGFGDRRDFSAATLHRRFCAGRRDGLGIAPLVHILHARTRIDGGDCIAPPG